MKRLLFALALLLQGSGQPITVPIQNPSFAQGTAGWVFGAGSSTGSNPDGTTWAGIGSGSTIHQILSTTPAQLQEYKPGYTIDGLYTISFSLLNYFPSYPGYFTVEIDFGSQELCDWSGWGDKVFTQIMHVCTSPGYLIVDKSLPSSGPAQGQQPFVLHITSSSAAGWPLEVTNFSMTFTPSN